MKKLKISKKEAEELLQNVEVSEKLAKRLEDLFPKLRKTHSRKTITKIEMYLDLLEVRDKVNKMNISKAISSRKEKFCVTYFPVTDEITYAKYGEFTSGDIIILGEETVKKFIKNNSDLIKEAFKLI